MTATDPQQQANKFQKLLKAINAARVPHATRYTHLLSKFVVNDDNRDAYLAASGHFHWDFRFESGSSFTETAQQTTTLTLTARAHS